MGEIISRNTTKEYVGAQEMYLCMLVKGMTFVMCSICGHLQIYINL